MSVMMEDFKPSVNPLEEVKKLQDLVRKLEIQNQQLRNKQIRVTKTNVFSSSKEIIKQTTTAAISALNVGNTNKDEHEGKIIPSNIIISNNKKSSVRQGPYMSKKENVGPFDDVDIIQVNDIDMSDDESWLYTSPKGLTPEQKNESPYKWLRKDVDDPENKELQFAKKALISKLDELAILSPPNQGRQHVHHVENPTISYLRKPQVPCKNLPQAQAHGEYAAVDTRTFTRSKKKQNLETIGNLPVIGNNNVERKDGESKGNIQNDDVSLDSSLGLHALTDVNDVQELARMQEESLRQSSPIGTPKRQSVSSLTGRRHSASSRSSVSDIEATEHPVFVNQISEDGSLRPNTSTPTLLETEVHNHSDHSTPPDSPYGSNVSLNSSGNNRGDSYRSSLPNLSRAHNGLQQMKNRNVSDAKQDKSLSVRTITRNQRSDSNLLTVTKTRREMMSPTRTRLRHPSSQLSSSGSSYYESPQTPASVHSAPPITRNTETSSRIAARSGLPRPARATSATRSRSGIPVPSTLSKKYASEDSWSEGCF